MILFKLFIKLLVLPIVVVVTLIQWIGIFIVSCSAWMFNLLSSLLFLIALVSAFAGAGAMQVIPLFIMAFTVFVVPFVGEWIVERIIDIRFALNDLLKM